MEFYKQTVKLIIELALAENTSETLEWEFNCLAFMFKYLAKILSQDLIPTFEMLEPLFNSKDHIARFSAEALSFLLRKTNQEQLLRFTDAAFKKIGNHNYNKSIVILFSESMKSTQGSVHSKFSIIIGSLLQNLSSDDASSVLCDIILNVLNFGSQESVKDLYNLISEINTKNIKSDPSYLNHFLKVTTILIFADSGKKIPDWSLITEALNHLIRNFKLESLENGSKDLIIYLLSIFFRNCEIQTLTKFHTSLFRFALTLESLFPAFIISIVELAKERSLKYAKQFVQEFINKKWNHNSEFIAYFLTDLEERQLISRVEDPHKFKISVPTQFAETVNKDLKAISITSSQDLYQAYWRLCVLSYSKNLEPSVFIDIIYTIKGLNQVSEFKDTTCSKAISLLTLTDDSSATAKIILENFEELYNNFIFVSCAQSYLKTHKIAISNREHLISLISNNLITPNHDLRHVSLQLICVLSAGFDEELVTIANQCDIIEQIPLSLANGRDIQLRMRGFAASFQRLDSSDDLRSQVFLKYLFGMLTIHFSPSWQIAYEVLPSVYHKNKQLVWELAFSFITGVYNHSNKSFFDGFCDSVVVHSSIWTAVDIRLENVINNSKSIVSKYLNKEVTLISGCEAKLSAHKFPEFMCTHALDALKKTPELVEKNSSSILPLVLSTSESEVENETTSLNFTKKERAELLGLFVSFKKLKSIPRANELYRRCLILLSSRTPEIRKIALDCLLNFKDERITKYKDNLSNLLDDATFRDEIQKITSKGDDSVIEDEDEDAVMPLILRIIFGRAQSNNISGNKKGIKFGAISILPQLDPKYIVDFLNIAAEKIYSEADNDFDSVGKEKLSSNSLRRCLGFCNMLNDLIHTLGEKFKDLLKVTIKPLLFSLVCAEAVIQGESVDEHANAVARNVRTSGMKDLLQLFEILNEFSWDDYIVVIYEKILSPRFTKFENENLQQTSSLLKIVVCWSQYKNYCDLLLINNLEPTTKVLSLLSNPHTKSEVISTVLDFCINIIKNSSKRSKYRNLTEAVSEGVFTTLKSTLSRITEPDVNGKIIQLLLTLVENHYVESQGRRVSLVDLCTEMLEKPSVQLSKESKLQVLKTLKILIQDFDGSFDQIQHLFEVSSKFLKFLKDRQQREVLIELFVEVGHKFDEYSRVANYLTELNSFSTRGLGEFDYDRRLSAFRDINEVSYQELISVEWVPILNTNLFFINEIDDLAIRSNASYTLKRFADALSMKEADKAFIRIFKDLVLSNVRSGLRSKNENIRFEFVSILAHFVSDLKHIDDFEDMKVLLFNNDEEANFFLNINHIQLHRRQRAIKRLGHVASHISGSNIAHYILPMIENYAVVTDEKLRNIANETVLTIEILISHVSYRQFIAIFKRYMAGLKEGGQNLRDAVNLVVTITKALLRSMKFTEGSKRMAGLPAESDVLDVQLEKEMIEPLSKVLNKRDEETIVYRTPLIEAIACLILGLTHERIVSILPGVLTKICQILRSRSDELRDAVRKHLGRAAVTLGAKYIKFIIKELKTALARGFQIHVLGFTVHSILSSLEIHHGDLDESASLIMDIIMENIFGSTGLEKEADGYRTSMKEVKHNKCFDLCEITAKVISISRFDDIIAPIRLLLNERISLKIQNKLDEVLRRLTLGIYKNEDSTKNDMLVLCFEMFTESEKNLIQNRHIPRIQDSEKHFLVELSAKNQRVESENSTFVDTFQKLSLELLRTTLNKNPNFVNAESLSGFIPFFEKTLESNNEAIIISTLRILGQIIRVQFDTESDIFKRAARKCLSIIKNFPSTESEVCQASLKFISIVIRHRDDLALKESSLGYLLVKIQPDMSEENRQGLAFNFLKAIVSKHLMLPEIYETMNKIREVMVTSHSKERRDMSRSIYFQFLMEYDQGRGRLEKQFKFLVDNLSYPADAGKQSVMELIHLIIQKSGPELLEAISSSFFVALSRILISESSTKSREMALALITSIFEKKGFESFEKFIRGWINSNNSSLLKCSLLLFRTKVKVYGFNADSDLDYLVMDHIKGILQNSRSNSETEVKWELVYAALNCLCLVAEKTIEVIDEGLKRDITACLLFPHSWIRLASSRLLCALMSSNMELFSSADVQEIGYRIFRLLGAPLVDERLGSQAVKVLTMALMYWYKNNVLLDTTLQQQSHVDADESDDEDGENEQIPESSDRVEQRMIYWAIKKAGYVVRSERTAISAKKAGIQFFAMSIELLSEMLINEVAEEVILPLFTLSQTEADDEGKHELQNLSLECLKLIEEKIGVSNYTSNYSKVSQFVIQRRKDRRTKRARLAITAPDAAARRKMKKHERTREKRKHEKDENGFYHTKKKHRN
jgi:U3 small nucleolar RNA-associated protein 20